MAALSACGNYETGQFTNDLQTQPFVSKLYGKATKTISIQSEAGSHIAWMGLDQAADYKYFRIERISVNGRETQPATVSSTTVLENISVGTPSAGSASAAANQILVTLTYSPAKAIESEDDSHKAFLLVAYDRPEVGIVRVELNGKTQGIIPGKCVRNAEAMEKVAFVIDSVDLYICDANANFPASQITPGAPGEQTNLTTLNILDEDKQKGVLTFYKPDDSTACVLGPRDDVASPTIPDFKIPIPKGISTQTDKIGELDVTIPPGFFAECTVQGGNINCDGDNKVDLEILGGLVPLSPILTLTNQTIAPTAPDCKAFNDRLIGSGTLDDDALTLVGWAAIGNNSNTAQFKIDGALVVAHIHLKAQ